MMVHHLSMCCVLLVSVVLVGCALADPGAGSGLATMRSLEAYDMATCLDGSPAIYYIRHGSESNRFFIFFEGGGFCTSHEDCADRARGSLGSTVNDSTTRSLDEIYFNTSAVGKPLLSSWTHVYVRYCDGAYYSGEQSQPVVTSGRTVFYRGRWITEAVLQDLTSAFGLGSATDVVFGGCSAGAIRVWAHLDALRSMVPPTARVAGFPDSGFYRDIPMFTSLKHFVVASSGQQATGLLSPACKRDYPGQEEKCIVGAVVAKYVQTPLFAWQSRYDTDQLVCEMNSTCQHSDACVNQYGEGLKLDFLHALGNNSGLGGFLDSCSRHCEGRPKDDTHGMTPMQAFAMWWGAGSQRSVHRWYSQNATYPCNDCCGAHTDTPNV